MADLREIVATCNNVIEVINDKFTTAVIVAASIATIYYGGVSHRARQQEDNPLMIPLHPVVQGSEDSVAESLNYLKNQYSHFSR